MRKPQEWAGSKLTPSQGRNPAAVRALLSAGISPCHDIASEKRHRCQAARLAEHPDGGTDLENERKATADMRVGRGQDETAAGWSLTLDKLTWFQSWPARAYTLGLLLFAAALALRFAVDPMLPPGFPFLTFFPAVIITAFVCGVRPGLLVAALSGLSAWYFFIAGPGHWPLSPAAALALGFFVLIVGIDLVIIAGLMRALRELREERLKSGQYAEQRDVLFSELQHRVGNNLQAISALLAIQARAVSDEKARRALQEATQRMAIIADIQRLYLDPDQPAAALDGPYVRELVEKCMAAAGRENQITLRLEIAPVVVSQDVFLPVALVLTECVNNALEHAFPASGDHLLVVSLAPGEALEMVLRIKDNGPGPPPGFEANHTKGVGMRVIHAFARQVRGSFRMFRDGGTVCELRFHPGDPRQRRRMAA